MRTFRGALSAFLDALAEISRQLIGTSIAPILATDAITKVVAEVLRDFMSAERRAPTISDRAADATKALTHASQIIGELETELANHKNRLDEVVVQIETKRMEANHWANLASFNEQQVAALTAEVERRLREQIRAEQKRNIGWRRVATFVIWLITLILGAINWRSASGNVE